MHKESGYMWCTNTNGEFTYHWLTRNQHQDYVILQTEPLKNEKIPMDPSKYKETVVLQAETEAKIMLIGLRYAQQLELPPFTGNTGAILEKTEKLYGSDISNLPHGKSHIPVDDYFSELEDGISSYLTKDVCKILLLFS